MPIVAITREMGSLGKDVARQLGAELNVPVVYHEVIDHLADRMRVRKSHVIRLFDGSAGLLERLTADQTSLSIYTADEIIGLAAQGGGAVIRRWGATHLLREVPHAVCVRVCAPFEIRKRRMMERLGSDDEDLALAASVRAALRRSPETRAAEVGVSSESGRVTLSGAGNTDEMLAFVEVASAVPGVRDVAYRTHPGEELRPRFH